MATLTIADAYREAVQRHRNGRVGEAEAIYRLILAREPDHADALHLFGVAAHQLGRLDEAAASIRRAIALRPDNAEYHHNLGEIWRRQNRFDDAIACFRTTLRLSPGFAAAYNSLGAVLLEAGDLAAAEAPVREALRLRPDYAEARFNLACIFERRGQGAPAVQEYQAAVRLQPALVPGHLHLGRMLAAAGQVEAARQSFQAALAADPRCATACNDLGNLAKDQGDLDAALQWYRRALEFDPAHHVAHSNLVYGALFHPDFDEAALRAEHERWRQSHAAALEAAPPAHRTRPDPSRRLRIGYVSPSFNRHVVGWNLLPLFRRHDRARFEIVCYADVLQPDDLTAEFRRLADRWVESAYWSDERLAAAIAADAIDILVDLSLHMAQHRLLVFARRPAPVQLTFAGYPGTTGLRSIRHRLTDEFLDPPTQASPYTEESLRLKSFWCFMPRGDEPEPAAPPSRASGRITFGCLNNFCKVTAPTLRLWARVLRAVPDSRLLLLAPPGSHRDRTTAALQGEGIAPERIEFAPRAGHRAYVELYQRIDIALDTLPYNGHTTTCDALWMGVPVVTLVGATVAGRAGLSQLTNLGLPELIARSPEEFAAIATALATDAPRLAKLRATLRQRMAASPLMDAAAFARDIEAAYCAMWRRECEAPAAQ